MTSMKTIAYSIFQLNDSEAATLKRFMGYEYTMKHGGVILSEYDTVYTSEITYQEDTTPAELLGHIYCTFNIDRPEDFYGHSLSVSDLVALEGIGTFFCDNIGWRQITKAIN